MHLSVEKDWNSNKHHIVASLRQYAGLLKLKYTIYMSMCADFISKKIKKSSHHFDLTLNSYKFITHFNILNSSNK